MQPKTIDLKKLSTAELNELGFQSYNELNRLAKESQQTEINIKLINQELASRQAPTTQPHEIQENQDDLPKGVQSEDNFSSNASGASN